MLRNVGNLITAIGSWASLAGLYWTVRPANQQFSSTEDGLIFVSVVLLIVHLGFEIVSMMKSRPRILKDDKGIEGYMRRWTLLSGRTSILSRDMSWVQGDMEEILNKLAGRSDLTVFMEKENDVALRLKERGAEIIYYGRFNLLPSTRFAITNEGRADARVALGFKDSRGHLHVNEYENGNPVFYLCNDIVHLLRTRLRF